MRALPSCARRGLLALLPMSFLGGLLAAQTVVITVPPPGFQSTLSSAEVEGLVIGAPGPAPAADVMFRTRYTDGTLCAPIKSDGSYDPSALGWDYDLDWDEVTGIGSFKGRVKWMRQGSNELDVYLPGDTLGSPRVSHNFVFQPNSQQAKDMEAIVHSIVRTVDVQEHDGEAGAIEFFVDLINTTETQSYTVDLRCTLEMPDGTVVDLPMGGPGIQSATYTVSPGDWSYTSAVDPVGMRFSFPLDQAPLPQPIQQGLYHMEAQLYDGPALIWEEEDIDFWVTDRSGKPFRDVTEDTAFNDVNLKGISSGSGLTLFDYNGDGLKDVFVANPSGDVIDVDALGFKMPYVGGHNYLLRNNGDATFTDVTDAAGVEGLSHVRSNGAAWGDLDRDGDNDLVVVNRVFRPYVYRNNGDGTFDDAGAQVITIPFGSLWCTAPALGDVDNDSDLDLFVGTYIKTWKSDYQHAGNVNRLLRNGLVEGDMSAADPTFPNFTNITSTSGLNNPDMCFGAFFWDYNRDGNLDLSVHVDFGGFVEPNRLYGGNGDGTFVDVGASTGYGVREFSMGAVAEDFDGNGWLDVYSTSVGLNSYLLGDASGTFTQAIVGSGAEQDFTTIGPQADGLNLNNNWGAIGFDYDRDQDMDLYVMGSDMFTVYQLPIPEIHPDGMLENDGNGFFTDQTLALGLENGGRGRSSGVIDYDGDGDLDLLISNASETISLIRNDFVTANQAIDVRPVTRRSAPGGFGTTISVTAGGKTQVRSPLSEASHTGKPDNLMRFGLGLNGAAEVTAEWHLGGSTTWFSLGAGQAHLLHETIVTVNDEIDGTAAILTQPDIDLYGPPGALGIAYLGIPGALPIPSGGTTDLFPLFDFMTLAFFDGNGEASWNLGTIPSNLAGGSIQIQMITYDLFSQAFPSKSGLSSLTVTP